MKEVYQKLFLLFPRKGQLRLSNYLFQYELSIALILVISVLLFTGCAPKYKDVLLRYRDADICCKSMSEFNYEKINVGQSKEVLIDENNPAFNFSSGKSYFKAYELPETPEPYHIKVVSYSLVGGGPNYIFYPVLITLDKNFDEVRNTGKSDFIPQKNVWLEIPAKFAMMEHGFKLTGGLTFTNKNKNEKYLVVKTNAKYLEKNTFFPTSIYYTGDGFGKLSKNSPTGAIVVALESTSNLTNNEFEKWFNSSENVKIDKTYIGDGFTVLPPQNPNYRFKDESLTRYGVTQRRISFGKYQGGETETETRIATQPSFQIVTKYSEPEIKVIPPPSFRKIFIPGMPVLVKTKDMEVLLRVTHYQANEYAIGLVEGQNKEIKISIDELKEISIVEEKIPKKKNKTEKVESKTYSSSEFSTAEEIVYSLPYLLVTPMLVTAPIIIPMTKSLESKWRKVDLIYQGITKNELITYLGEPEGKYKCSHVFGFGIPVREIEIWEYSNEKVLRGAELMFIELEQQEVYHSEGKWDFMFYNNWKSDHNCSVIIENNEP